MVAASALLVGVILCRRGLDDVLRAVAGRLQVLQRSLARAALRQELWNGNRETFKDWLDPTHPIRWAWSTHDRRRGDYEAAMAGDDRWVRLRSRRQVKAWLASL